jgi:hypothetical protein
MRNFFTLILLFACVLTLQAQSFVFVKDEVELPNNASVEVTDVETFPVVLMESGLTLVNTTPNTLNITASQTVIQAPVSSEGKLNLCFVECKPTNGNFSITGSLTPKGDLFHTYFEPQEGVYETVVVKYEIVNNYDITDKIAVTVTYKYGNGTGVKTPQSNNVLGIYQDENQLIFDTRSINGENLQATVYDVTGRKKATQFLQDNARTALTAHLEKGIYLIVLTNENGVVETRKFIFN